MSQLEPMIQSILQYNLKTKIYQGDRRNFNFDKYCLIHVAEHNCYTSLVEYGVNPLEESKKILYFEDGEKPERMLFLIF